MAKKDKPEPKTAGDLTGNGGALRELLSFVERVERLNEELEGLTEDRAEVFNEAKATGFDTKTLRKAIQRRKMDSTARQEGDALLELYEDAIRKAEKAAFDKSMGDGA